VAIRPLENHQTDSGPVRRPGPTGFHVSKRTKDSPKTGDQVRAPAEENGEGQAESETGEEERPAMKVLFLHGFGSDPNGIRPTFLKESGHDVTHPALPDHAMAKSVRIAQKAFDETSPDVVIGSSRGGAVALKIETGDTPLVLIAPAWRTWFCDPVLPPNTVILHSEHDDVVPIEGSRELLQSAGLPEDRLVVVGENHKMTDPAAFAALLNAIDQVTR